MSQKSDAYWHGYDDAKYGFTYISNDANAYAEGAQAFRDEEAKAQKPVGISYERKWTWLKFEQKPAQEILQILGEKFHGKYCERWQAWYFMRRIQSAEFVSAGIQIQEKKMKSKTDVKKIAELKETLKKVMDKVEEICYNLYFRWQDEHEYEDIKDYGEPIKKAIKGMGATFVKMQSRPFGFVIELDGAKYLISINSKMNYSIARAK